MTGLEDILFSKQPKQLLKNKIGHGIKSLGNRIRKYAETGINRIGEYVKVGIDRTKEYVETANKYITNTIDKVEHGIDKIREYKETAKYVIPNALMNTLIFSNEYGRMAYYSAKAYISYKTVKQVEKGKIYYGKSNTIVPIIAGVIGSVLGFGAAILLGDINSLIHQNHNLENQYQQLEQQYQELQQQYQNLQNQYQLLQQQYRGLENQYQNLGNQYQGLEQQYQSLENQYQSLLNQYQNLLNQYQQLQQQYQGLDNQYQQLEQQYQSLENQYQQLEQQYQNLENEVQNINTLTEIFYNNNSYDISVIQVNSVQIENGTAYVQGTTSFGANVTLEIPIQYVENSNVNIQEFVNDVQQNGWNAYILIDRADLQYMNISNNQNGTYVISIQPNEQLNIGVSASTANASTLDNVLNQLTNYNIVIQDGNNSYPYNSLPSGYLWGWNKPSNSTVVIDFQNYSQYQQAENMINIADQIINSPGNPNPTNSGYIDTYSIFNGTMSVYQNYSNYYPEYIVGQTYIPLIVLQSGQGNTIINTVSS
jgi:transcription initiation factor TFIID TATA-box-binding protein